MDDGDKAGAMTGIVGYMVSYALELLAKEGVVIKDSPVRNLGWVLGLLIKWANGVNRGMGGEYSSQTAWIKWVVDFVSARGIEFTKPNGIKEIAASVKGKSNGHEWASQGWTKKVSLWTEIQDWIWFVSSNEKSSILHSRRV